MEEEGVRFAGIINENGKLIAGGFKPGVVPYAKDKEKFHRFLTRVVDFSLGSEHDEALGRLNYLKARRDKLVLISFPFPVSKIILLVSAEPAVDIEKLASRVSEIFSDSKLFSDWDLGSQN